MASAEPAGSGPGQTLRQGWDRLDAVTKLLAAVTGCLVAFAGVLGAVAALRSIPGGPPPTPTATATATPSSDPSVRPEAPKDAVGAFVTPADGSSVASPVAVSGTASIPEDVAVWLMVRPDDGRFYFAERRPLQVSGDRWKRSARLGRDDGDLGRAYELVLVATPSTGSNFHKAIERAEAEGGSASVDALPADSQRLAGVTVRLGDS